MCAYDKRVPDHLVDGVLSVCVGDHCFVRYLTETFFGNRCKCNGIGKYLRVKCVFNFHCDKVNGRKGWPPSATGHCKNNLFNAIESAKGFMRVIPFFFRVVHTKNHFNVWYIVCIWTRDACVNQSNAVARRTIKFDSFLFELHKGETYLFSKWFLLVCDLSSWTCLWMTLRKPALLVWLWHLMVS